MTGSDPQLLHPQWISWAIEIGVGVIICSLIGIIYKITDRRIEKGEEWRKDMPSKEEVLTKFEHGTICHGHTVEFARFMTKQHDETMSGQREIKSKLEAVADIVGKNTTRLSVIETRLHYINGKDEE